MFTHEHHYQSIRDLYRVRHEQLQPWSISKGNHFNSWNWFSGTFTFMSLNSISHGFLTIFTRSFRNNLLISCPGRWGILSPPACIISSALPLSFQYSNRWWFWLFHYLLLHLYNCVNTMPNGTTCWARLLFSTFPWNLGHYQLMGWFRHHSLVITWLNWPYSLTLWIQTLCFFLRNICSQAKWWVYQQDMFKKNHWCLFALCVTKRPLSEVDSRVKSVWVWIQYLPSVAMRPFSKLHILSELRFLFL